MAVMQQSLTAMNGSRMVGFMQRCETAVAAAVQAGKRSMIAKTPQPAKKAKVELKEPKSAPAKMGKGAHLTQFANSAIFQGS